MHFHLAAVFMLVPLLAAAPTPNLDKRVPPVDVTDTVKEALKQLTAPLGEGLPKPASGKRDGSNDILAPVTELLKPITGGDITKLPTGGKRQVPELPGGLTEILGGLIPASNGKRDGPTDIITKVTDSLKPVTGGGLGQLPGSGKRQVPDLPGGLTQTLEGLTKPLTGGGLGQLPGSGKRQVPDLPGGLTQTLEGLTKPLTGGGVGQLPGSGKRQLNDLTAVVTGPLQALTGPLGAVSPGKRQAPDAANLLKGVVDTALGQGNVENPKNLLNSREAIDVGTILAEALRLTKPVDTKVPSTKRQSLDVTKAIEDVLNPVNEGLSKDHSDDFKYPAGLTGKRNDGIDVVDAVDKLLKPVGTAFENSKDFKGPDGKKAPLIGKRGGVDATGTLSTLVDQVTNAVEKSPDFQYPKGVEVPSKSSKRQLEVLTGVLDTITKGAGGAGGAGFTYPDGMTPAGKRQEADAAGPLASALLELAKTLGGNAAKDGKVPEGFGYPEGVEIPAAEKRDGIDVASAAKAVLYQVIDGVSKPV